MKRRIGLTIKFFIALACIIGVSADDVCSELNVTAITTTEMVNSLWAWCLDDTDCVDLFYQEDPNITVFNYLANPIAAQYDSLDSPYNDLFCNKTKDEALTNLWLLLLKSKIDEIQVCDINHILVIDRDELSSKCICRGDRVCKDISDHLTLLYVMISFFIVIGVGVIILLGVDIYTRVTSYNKTKKNTENAKAAKKAEAYFNQLLIDEFGKKRNPRKTMSDAIDSLFS